MKLFLLFSHVLTELQTEDAEKNLKIDEIIYMPDEIKEIWSNVNPEIFEEAKLNRIKIFLNKNSLKGDFVLIQGEWGFTYHMINYSKNIGLIPIYSTTKRDYREELQTDGTVKNIHYFKHIKYKEYI